MGAVSLQPNQTIQAVQSAAIDAVRPGGEQGRQVSDAEFAGVVGKFRDAMRHDSAAVATAMKNIDSWFGEYSQNGVNLTPDARALMTRAYEAARASSGQGAPGAPPRP